MAVDILRAFRVRLDRDDRASAVVVGWCRMACGWRWHVEWPDGSNGPWSGASYASREVARDVAKCALRLEQPPTGDDYNEVMGLIRAFANRIEEG